MNKNSYLMMSILSFLFLALTNIAGAAQYDSAYTKLKNCEIIEEPSEPDEPYYAVRKCDSKANYEVLLTEADGRSWITLNQNGEELINLYKAEMESGLGGFPYVAGKVAEWRYQGKTPIAFIFRAGGDDNKTKLLVVRLANQQACVIGATTSNVTARKIADGNKGCD